MSGQSGPIRVLVIEHNWLMLEGLSRLLSELPDVELAGRASTGPEGVTLFKQKRPAITVIDLELPDMTAARLVREIRQLDARASILILATYELDGAGAEAIASGAAAIIAKDQIGSMLTPLIRSLAARRRES